MLPNKKRINRSLFLKILEKGKFIAGNSINLKFIDYNKIKDFFPSKNENKIKKTYFFIFFLKPEAEKLSFKKLEEEILFLLKKGSVLFY